eukprot:3804622-Amphidinium_carterae.1
MHDVLGKYVLKPKQEVMIKTVEVNKEKPANVPSSVVPLELVLGSESQHCPFGQLLCMGFVK